MNVEFKLNISKKLLQLSYLIVSFSVSITHNHINPAPHGVFSEILDAGSNNQC